MALNCCAIVNTQLAKRLLERGGVIISEYEEGTPHFKQNFVARNRIVAGLADVLLITEATERSGFDRLCHAFQ